MIQWIIRPPNEEVLLDNVRALGTLHDPATREVTFNARLKASADYWRFRPRACAPYRARSEPSKAPSVRADGERARTSAAAAT